jgi:hypothetical protein
MNTQPFRYSSKVGTSICISICLSSAVFITGCATTQPMRSFALPVDYVPLNTVIIQDKFTTHRVTQDTLAEIATTCISTMPKTGSSISSTAQQIPSRNLIVLGHVSSAHSLVLSGSDAFCLKQSEAKNPIFAAEGFLSTVNPQGVPPDIEYKWYRNIAKAIAEKGTAKVSFQFKDGNAYDVTYWAGGRDNYSIKYSMEHRKSGTVAGASFDEVFSHPTMTSISQTTHQGRTVKIHPLAHLK